MPAGVRCFKRIVAATTVVLHGLDYASAEQVSQALGGRTVWQELSSRRPETLPVTSWTHAEQHTARRLLTADEVRPIGAGLDAPCYWKSPPNSSRTVVLAGGTHSSAEQSSGVGAGDGGDTGTRENPAIARRLSGGAG
ncbi:MAG: TraM recognition domain-containing protein [Chloroflexota bacterium]|nr:MAG: hypothetical protein DLM70_03705 [Chloroflexota bacterium]